MIYDMHITLICFFLLLMSASMDFYTVLLISLLATFWSSTYAGFLDVVDIGAVGDGKTDDSEAFMEAWQRVCGAPGPSTLFIPPRRTFLLRPVMFQGPCRYPSIHVRVQGNIVAPSDTSQLGGANVSNWIAFGSVNGLIVDGNGQIDGQGANWWKLCDTAGQKCPPRPYALSFAWCNGLYLGGLKLVNAPGKFISIYSSNNTIIASLGISAPGDSPNTDGITIAQSNNVLVNETNIGTGDDCIAIISGSSNIKITRVTCGPGHGISIGSLGHNGEYGYVEGVRVWNSTFIGTSNGARIKTWQGGKGYVRNITYDHITLVNTSNPILIDQFYCPWSNCANQTNAVAVTNITYTEFSGTCSSEFAIDLSCSQGIGCTNILMDHIYISPVDANRKISSKIINELSVRIFKAHGRATDTDPNVQLLP